MVGERLQELRKAKGLTTADVAAPLGIEPRTYYAYERNERDVSTSTLCRLADFFGVTVDYLLGREEKSRASAAAAQFAGLDDTHQAVVKAYMSMPRQTRDMLIDTLYELVEAPRQMGKIDDSGRGALPVLTALLHANKASAGCGYDLSHEDEWREITVLDTPTARRADFAVTVEGDSMLPDYEDGDVVFIQQTPDIEIGQVGLFIHDGKGYIKERGARCLISRNPEFQDIYGESAAVGLVIGKAQRV